MVESACEPEHDVVKKRRYVAHFDMLGFESIVENQPDIAWEALNTLWDHQSEIPEQPVLIDSKKKHIQSPAKTVFFSDTIIIYTEQDEYEDYVSIFAQSTNLFLQSLVAGIPLRGGIAHGDFWADRSKGLYMGVPLFRAYHIGEKAQWLGVVIAPETYRVNLEDDESHYFKEWEVPVKGGGTETSIVVNWPNIYRGLLDLPKSARELYERGFSKLYGRYDELGSREIRKYENTQIFIESWVNSKE